VDELTAPGGKYILVLIQYTSAAFLPASR